METSTLERKTYEYDSLRAARQIVGDLVELRDKIKTTAEGFAILDFVQGHVATDLPAATASDIVELMRGDAVRGGQAARASSYPNDLVLFWLENYRRAYSHMIMRVLEDGADPMNA